MCSMETSVQVVAVSAWKARTSAEPVLLAEPSWLQASQRPAAHQQQPRLAGLTIAKYIERMAVGHERQHQHRLCLCRH